MAIVPERFKVLGAGIFSMILTMGIARFAYTPLLPVMQHQAGLGVAEAGWLAAVNYAGYLSGAVVASLVGDLVLKDRLYRVGMVLAVVTTVMMGASGSSIVWIVSRYLAGLSTAAGMLLGTGLVLNWLIRHDQRPELGIHFSGIGIGIVGASVAVELMNRWQLDWHAQWYVLTLAACVTLIPALAWLPRPVRTSVTRSGQSMLDAPPSPVYMRLFLAAYFCAGVGYVVSSTFIVAIVDQLPGMSGRGTLIFLFVGLGAAPGVILWDLIARRTGDLGALILGAILQLAGILLPVLGHSVILALAGAALFGATVTGLVSIVLKMAGRFYPTRPGKMMGKMTLSYGIAQVIAPAVTGVLAARAGDYWAGLYLAAAVMAVGAVLFGLLRIIDGRGRRGVAADRVAGQEGGA